MKEKPIKVEKWNMLLSNNLEIDVTPILWPKYDRNWMVCNLTKVEFGSSSEVELPNVVVNEITQSNGNTLKTKCFVAYPCM